MKNTKAVIASIILTCSILIFMRYNVSRKDYDADIKIPDSDGHGYSFTPLGCLLSAPWEFEKGSFTGHNISYSIDGNYLPYNKTYFTENENNLVFELHKNGTLKYWFKTDYLKSPIDTIVLANGNKSINHNILPSSALLLQNIYIGSWSCDFKDSTITIDFGKNEFGLFPINGKYNDLGSRRMVLEENYYMDSIYNGKPQKIRKNITTYFVHY